jgi:hypothetical protein
MAKKDTVAQKNALEQLKERFAEYGLGSDDFVAAIRQSILDNTDAEGNIAQASAAAAVRATPAYKARFAGNEARKIKIQADIAAGKIPAMAELSEASYIKAEDGYREVLRKQGVPESFYNNTAYLSKLIGNDLSVDEVGSRASLAQQAAQQVNPEIRQQLQSLYGVSDKQIAGFFLDPELGQQNINAVAAGNAAIVSAAAKRSGMDLAKADAEALAARISPDNQQAIDATKLFSATAVTSGLTTGDVSGGASGVTASDVVIAATGDVEAQAKLEKEKQKRQAEYQSASGMAETQKGVVGLQRANL